MKPQLLPLYFEPGRDDGFDRQLIALRRLFENEVELLPPQPLRGALAGCDAVIFPQLLGEAFKQLHLFKQIDRPILIVTSESGTVSMWDWELISWLREAGVPTIAPYSRDQARQVFAALRTRRELTQTRFVVYQDNPGQGQQASIFKRFYWWENECTQRLIERFGITLEKRSYRELGLRAKDITDQAAETARATWDLPTDGVLPKALNSSTKLYLAIKNDIGGDPHVRAVGINCLNESHFSDSTPCLAWNRLFTESGIIWGCEGDSVTMLSKFVLHRSLGCPILMTNLYPFLLGDEALNHERIPHFPEVAGDPRNYVLIGHCGYMGVIPQSFTTEWTLRPPVLPIVDGNSAVIDARLPVGAITLAKIHADFSRLTLAEGQLEGYAQFPGSDCRNGGIVRLSDGHRLMGRLASHHYVVMTGHQRNAVETIAPIFGLELEII